MLGHNHTPPAGAIVVRPARPWGRVIATTGRTIYVRLAGGGTEYWPKAATSVAPAPRRKRRA
ncbi:hypothetical protein PQJ75_00935 [Rhodoplanes sp. TEM]|uniref:Uncharacterized protein n=1 Tax=Rhodoplanes tepidamans TaxID=200616 RepID=A0ABT5J5L9_RHOTP|nr:MULTISPECIES: hypothetical protein [Rhodoplanes]MDC7784818.1 hypothetical protein [Rhodoplanes tepidamans]MDC7982285.1 hypothetical protein [Rhodoplanes sp. TEM]MDQ0356292.1 hypothetical protein [Rhodoplanes tepidamans]